MFPRQVRLTAPAAAAPRFGIAPLGCCVRLVGQPDAGQRHAGEADAEFLQRRAPRDRLGHAFGEFIELVVHILPDVIAEYFYWQ